VAAYRDRARGRVTWVAFAIYLAAGLGLLGVIMWRVWAEVLAGLGPL
jgi:hypothetical protein